MKLFKRLKKESGAYTVLTAIMLTVLVGFLALSVDFGYHYYRGAQLQNATDAAATAVAGSLGTIDTQYEEIAYQYLAKNGFPDRDKVRVNIEIKGETTYETVDSDDYIKAGYYKLTVSAEDNTFFANLLDIDSMKLVKHAYVKADANYVAMPKALNYTVFAGSTKGTPSNPALQINGKTGGIVNSLTSLTQNIMNGFNTWVVKPIQAFTFTADTWWNPTTWKVRFNWDNANSWQAKLYTSNLTTSGDVHSNSNMESKIQAIHASRIQDVDFTNSISTVDLAKYFDMTPIEDVVPTFDDYGQVTFDAVKQITFKVPSGVNILGKDGPLDTYYYVQNQQYIEQTQLTLRILDLMDVANIDSTNLQRDYEEAAELYLTDKIVTADQKEAIKNQVADGKLTYDMQTKEFTLKNQTSMIYSVNAEMANNALDIAYDTENESGKYQGIDKMIFGEVDGDENTYHMGIAYTGNDVLYSEGERPYYSMRDVDGKGDEYDNRDSFEDMVNFIKYDELGEQTVTATAAIRGNVINRNYQDFNSQSKDKLSQLFFFTNAYTFNKEVKDATKAGADFAIARTFIENSDYIEVPNLKPYFIRQINKSIRNATKVKEKINQSSAGQPTIRYAAKERTDTLKSYQDNLNYYDDTYKAADATNLNITQSNIQLFREFKDNKNSRVVNLNDTPITYNRTTQDGLNYSVSISRYSYKGYNLYNSQNILKTPSEFYTEKLAEREQTKKDGAEAVKDYYDNTSKSLLNSVSTKRIALENNSEYSYSSKKTSVAELINAEKKPTITNIEGSSVTQKVFINDSKNATYSIPNHTVPANSTTAVSASSIIPSTNINIGDFSGKSVNLNASSYISTVNSAHSWAANSFTYPNAGGTDDKYVRCKWDGTQDDSSWHRIWLSGESKTKKYGFLNTKSDTVSYSAADKYIKTTDYSAGRGFIVPSGTYFYATNYIKTGDTSKESLRVNGTCLVGGGTTTTNSRAVYSCKDIYIDEKGFFVVNGSAEAKDVYYALANSFTLVQNNLVCSDLQVSSGAVLVVNGNLTVNGPLTNNGTIICRGTLTVTGAVSCSETGITYTGGEFKASGDVTLSSKHKLYSIGSITVKNITLTNSFVHTDSDFTSTNTSTTSVTLKTSSILEAMNNCSVTYRSVDSSSILNLNIVLEFTSGSQATFSDFGEYVSGANYNGGVLSGSRSPSGVSLSNVVVKVEGDLNLNGGALNLINGSVLYVTGNLSCGSISITKSKLYVDGNVTCSSISEGTSSMFLVRNGAAIAASNYSSITCSGNITVASSSKLYCEGNVTNKGISVMGSGKAYGYRAVIINYTSNYSSGANGLFNCSGSASEIFCGSYSTVSNKVGIIASGSIFYPFYSGKTFDCNHLEVQSGGKVIIDGNEGDASCTVRDWSEIYSGGIFCNHGKTTIVNCRFINEGKMYFLGGEDLTSANKTDMTDGETRKSNPDFFYFKKGSESFIGKPYNGTTKQTTLTYVSAYESWGDVYIDANVKVKGIIQDYVQNIVGVKTEKGGQSFVDESEIRVGHLGTAIYIAKGKTYIDGNLTTYDDTSKDSGIHIGKYDKSNNDAGLIVNGDINLASAIYNYGQFIVRGAFNLNTANKKKVTEKNDSSDYKKGKSIQNGRNENDISSVFFVGNYNPDGSIKNANASTNFYGYIENYGSIYYNYKLTSVKGYNDQMKDGQVLGDFAFINFSGSNAHFGGAVRLNSNQLLNKWANGSNETIFSCDGKLTYGGCIFNCGTLIAKGDISNNETNAETENSKKYLSDDHFSIMNGFTKLNKSVRENFSSRVYPAATVFCGGKLEVGVTEQGGESGSIISCGTMYINGDMNIYTNASSFKLTLKNFTEFWKNPESHSYFRTALWLYDNSNTFVGGNCFAGAGVATGKDSIFMVGGDYRSKRSTKLGIQMFMGTSGALGITLLDDYMSYKENTGDSYNSAYFYVGGNALVNTIGSTVKAFGVVTAPENNSRDMDIYPNTNIYIGGSLYANCKVYMKTNTDMIVAGKKTFYDNNGNLSNLIYTSMFTSPKNFVPEKNVSNGLTVQNHLNANKNLKFYVYQEFDMSPNSSMVVNGAMQVNETSKIRDMTKSYVYGSFTCGKYVELGKSENGKDYSGIVDFSTGAELIAKDSSGRYKYLTDDEIAEVNKIGEAKFVSNYVFEKSAYMFVDGDYTSGQDLGTGILNILDKIKKWVTNTFLSTGYTKVYASSALKVNGNFTSSRYITLRHDAKVYCKGNMDAATSIEGGVYSEWYVGGHMEAAASTATKVIDTLVNGLLDISARGKIEFFDQARVIVGGNMFSSASIDIGELPSGAYTRGRKTAYTVSAPEGSNSYYETESDFQEALILTYNNGSYTDKSGQAVYLDGSTYKYSNLKGSDNKNIEFGSKDNVIVYNTDDGKYHKKTYDGEVQDYSDGEDDSPDGRTPDTNNGLDSDDESNTFGAEVFCQGSMVALNGHIKEYAYTISVVGDYVYAPDYITLRSNADLWVLPETFGNETYDFLPYPDKPEERGGFITRLFNNITYYLGKFAYETTENLKFQTGSVYTFGSLTVNKNASLMGTNDLLQLGTITHADDSSTSGLEKFLSKVGTFLNPRQVVLREDSLVLFGSNVTISSAPIALNLDVLKGDTSVAGFDSKGNAVYPGYQYTCTNHDINGPHKGYSYTMTVDADEHAAIQNGSETLTCDICNQAVNKNKFKIVQVSHPAVVYAGNSLYISTTVDMLMTYLIADQGDVYLHNFYTKTAYDEKNLKELPNAISSYNGDINYTAWVGQLSSLFYAPMGNINFDGIYTDIYGSVIGNTVQMNAYYQNFHRFSNWRTMDLHIAESGSVYLIPESVFNNAPELGQVFDLTSGSQYKDSPYGVRIFF